MEESKIRILPSENVSKAKFIADQNNDDIYYAHPTTILAMKKDILAYSDLLNADPVPCQHCHEPLHRGMWNLCPYCESKLT